MFQKNINQDNYIKVTEMSNIYSITQIENSDISELIKLFRDTVHHINCKDYSKAQIDVWAPETINTARWLDSFRNSYAIKVLYKNQIVGFSNVDSSGYLDMFYVHKDYQNQGIGTLMINDLESWCIKNNITEITSFVSITARPFFEAKGYSVFFENEVIRDGISLINYKMNKTLNNKSRHLF